jgi:hypothetical protein
VPNVEAFKETLFVAACDDDDDDDDGDDDATARERLPCKPRAIK